MNIDWLLIRKSVKNELSEDERLEFERWLNESSEHRSFYENMLSHKNESVDTTHYKILLEERFDAIDKRRKIEKRRKITLWSGVAAAMILFFSLPTIIHYNSKEFQIDQLQAGGNKAFLIINNEQPIELNQNDDYLRKVASHISHQNTHQTAEIRQHRLVTPRGSEYSITLSDGTTVWLNAQTELIFPDQFTDSVRHVTLRGEAYFMVSKESNRPFIISADGVDVKVYGTEFNINTRSERWIQTTLVEGEISVKTTEVDEVMIKPGEMAQYNKETHVVTVSEVDVNQYIAWKNREYRFEDAPLRDILNELSLWYDFDVVFENEEAGNMRFTLYVPRESELENVIEYIEKTGSVKFEVKNRKLIIK